MDGTDKVISIVLGVIILLAVGLGIANSQTTELTTYDLATNETVNASTLNSIRPLLNDNVLSGSQTVRNNTGLLASGTDYVVTDYNQGFINFTNAANVNKFVNVSYSYEPPSFLGTSGTSVTILRLLGIFIAVAALIFLVKEIGLGSS